MGLIEGWSNALCEKFNTAPINKESACPKEYCDWQIHGNCAGNFDPDQTDPKYELGPEYKLAGVGDRYEIAKDYIKRVNIEKARRASLEDIDVEVEVEAEDGDEGDLERARAVARRAQGEFQDRGRVAEDAELVELERNMNAPIRKPEIKIPTYPSKPSGQIPLIQMPRRPGNPIAQRQIAQPPIVQDIPVVQPVFPPYQTNIYNNNVFMKNKYLSVRSDQYDFDSNANVPRATGLVKSIRSTRPSSRSRVQRIPDKKLDKPARPEKNNKNNKKIKAPPTFAKIINQLLPILLIALILIYIIYFYRKRSR